MVDESRRRGDTKVLPYVDLWIGILDEFQSWFISLDVVIYSERRSSSLNDFEKASSLVVKKIIADTFAVRTLVLAGFDTAARLVLRSLIEYADFLVMLIHEPKVASDFIDADGPEENQKFWEKHIRGGRLRKSTRRVLQDVLGDDQAELADWLSNWGGRDEKILGGLAHPSWAGGYFSAITFKAMREDEAWLGIWGDRADVSAETIFMYIKRLLPLIIFSGEFPFDFDKDLLDREYDEKNEIHWHVEKGRAVLGSLLLSLADERSSGRFFPELDMSFLPQD